MFSTFSKKIRFRRKLECRISLIDFFYHVASHFCQQKVVPQGKVFHGILKLATIKLLGSKLDVASNDCIPGKSTFSLTCLPYKVPLKVVLCKRRVHFDHLKHFERHCYPDQIIIRICRKCDSSFNVMERT